MPRFGINTFIDRLPTVNNNQPYPDTKNTSYYIYNKKC